MKPETKSVALSYSVVAMEQGGGGVTILEAQQEFLSQEGGYSSAVPAKSIYLNATSAKRLQTFLNDVHPPERVDLKEARRLIEDALQSSTFGGTSFTKSAGTNQTIKEETRHFRVVYIMGPLLRALQSIDPCPKCSVIKPFASTCKDCGDSGVAGGLPFDVGDLTKPN